jgi:hypothetical protein
MPYTYQGETTVIPGVAGDFCPACGESILEMKESMRTSSAMLEFKKHRDQAKIDALRVAIIAGENSGDPVPLDIEELIRELKQKIVRPPHE